LVIEKASTTERIDNYPGFVEGIDGSELADQMKAHAERFDVEILPAQTVTQIQTDGDHKSILPSRAMSTVPQQSCWRPAPGTGGLACPDRRT